MFGMGKSIGKKAVEGAIEKAKEVFESVSQIDGNELAQKIPILGPIFKILPFLEEAWESLPDEKKTELAVAGANALIKLANSYSGAEK